MHKLPGEHHIVCVCMRRHGCKGWYLVGAWREVGRTMRRTLMKIWLAALSMLFGAAGCASQRPQFQAEPSAAFQSQSSIPSIWAGRGSAEAQRAIRECLERERAQGDINLCIDARPSTNPGAFERPSGLLNLRQMSWVTIDNWEVVMKQSIAWLYEHGPRKQIEDSQAKWEASMLADIGLYMDMFEGGSMSGEMARIGAEIRADATIERALFLEKFRALLEMNE